MPQAVRSSLDPDERNCQVHPPLPGAPTDGTESPCRDLQPGQPDLPFKKLPCVLSSAGALRHRCWWNDHQRVYRALDAVYPDGQRAVRFGVCGWKAHVERSDSNPPEYRIAAEFCRDRWCRPCQRERGRIIAANIVEHLDGRFCRFLTLTIRTADLTLRQAVQKLYTSFARLRLTTFWRTRVTGGCATCEVKLTKDGLRWHPHLHILLEGSYLPIGWLAKHWQKITGDSYICDITACSQPATAARYVTKYLSKPVPSSILRSPEHLKEAMVALDGRHMVATFGNWRGLELTHSESQAAWEQLCTYRELVERVQAGDAESKHILSHLLGQHNLDPSKLDDWLRESQAVHDANQLFLDLSGIDT